MADPNVGTTSAVAQVAHSPVPGQSPSPVQASPPRRTIAEITADLSKPIPKRFLETRKQGGATLTYISWHRAQRLLDYYCGSHWSYEIREKGITGTHILFTVRVIIHASDGDFYRDGTGIEALDMKGYGDPSSNAESMAFRRACARFGLGIDLYEKD